MNSPGERKDAVWVRVYNFIPFFYEEHGAIKKLEGIPEEVLEQVRVSCGTRPPLAEWARRIREQASIPADHPTLELCAGLPEDHPVRTLLALTFGFPGQPWVDVEAVRWDDGREVSVRALLERWLKAEMRSV